MSGNEGVLVDRAPDVTARDVVSDLECRGEVPLLLAVESICGDATRDVNALGDVGDLLEGSLNTVIDVVEKTGAEFDRQWLAGTNDWITDLDTSWNGLGSASCIICNALVRPAR